MNKDIDVFYKKALKKILNFKASELSNVEFEQVKRNAEKLEVYRFVRRKKMWKCKECKTEIIEDYRQITDEQGNFAGDMFVGFVCPKCLNFGIVEEHIANWEEMNREFEFRAWLTKYNKMVKIYSWNILQEYFMCSEYDSEFYLEETPIMQYTKKILYVVEWIDCGLKGRQIKNISWIGLDYWKDDIEVIGNIYENPELMEDK